MLKFIIKVSFFKQAETPIQHTPIPSEQACISQSNVEAMRDVCELTWVTVISTDTGVRTCS